MKDIKINYLNNIYHIRGYEDVIDFVNDNHIIFNVNKDKSIYSNLNQIFDIVEKNILNELKHKLLYQSFNYLNDIDEKISEILKSKVSPWLDYNLKDYDLAFNLNIGFELKYFHLLLTKRKNGELYVINVLTK